MSFGDDDLQSRFDALRRADERAASAFDALVTRPRAHRRRPLVLSVSFAAAAIVLAIVSLRLVGRPVAVAPPVAPSIVTWQSPTAAFLQTPGLELLRTVPTLRSSLLRGAPLDSLVTRHPGA